MYYKILVFFLSQVGCALSKVFVELCTLLRGGKTITDFDLYLNPDNGHAYYEAPKIANEKVRLPTSTISSTMFNHTSNNKLQKESKICSCGLRLSAANDCKHYIPLRTFYERNHHLANSNSSSNNKGVISNANDDSYDTRGNVCDEATDGKRVSSNMSYLLMDGFHAKLNALKFAFEAVSQLYDVEYCIFDR